MNIAGLSTAGLLKLHGAILEALQIDDNTPKGQAKPYGAREYPDWRSMGNELEVELDGRGIKYSKIAW